MATVKSAGECVNVAGELVDDANKDRVNDSLSEHLVATGVAIVDEASDNEVNVDATKRRKKEEKARRKKFKQRRNSLREKRWERHSAWEDALRAKVDTLEELCEQGIDFSFDALADDELADPIEKFLTVGDAKITAFFDEDRFSTMFYVQHAEGETENDLIVATIAELKRVSDLYHKTARLMAENAGLLPLLELEL